MLKSQKMFISSVMLTVATVVVASSPTLAQSSKMEKCYGIVKAGKNDCASKSGSHSCAGSAQVNSSQDEWIYLPQGSCNRITGGSL